MAQRCPQSLRRQSLQTGTRGAAGSSRSASEPFPPVRRKRARNPQGDGHRGTVFSDKDRRMYTAEPRQKKSHFILTSSNTRRTNITKKVTESRRKRNGRCPNIQGNESICHRSQRGATYKCQRRRRWSGQGPRCLNKSRVPRSSTLTSARLDRATPEPHFSRKGALGPNIL